MPQSPSALFIVKYRNLSPALVRPVALREYKNVQSGQIPSAPYSGKCTKRLEEVAPCGHFILSNKSREWRCDTQSCWCWAPPAGSGESQSMWCLGIQNDASAVLHFSALEGGVSLLQILDHRQQPSRDTLTWLHPLSFAFCSIYETKGAQWCQPKNR